jgi:enediyne biosynthesis protein E4
LSRLLTVALLVAVSGCNNSPPPPGAEPAETAPVGPFFFRDVTADSGVQAVYRNGEEAGLFAILETLGGGVALLDYDGDGLLDLFLPGGGYFEGQEIRGHPSKLFKNLGGFRFRDVTCEAGLDRPLFYTHGCAAADYDGDGWPDLLVTGFGRLALFHNEPDGKGGRRFVEVAKQAGLDDDLWSTSAAWADLDGDGFPDLYVCHYVNWSLTANHPVCLGFDGQRRDICPPGHFTALPHRLYRNNGDGTFRDVSKAAGLRVEHPQKDYGKGLGVLAVDVNGDGQPDLYVTNDQTDKLLYLNRSRPLTPTPLPQGARGKEETPRPLGERGRGEGAGALLLEEDGLHCGVARDHLGATNGSMGVAAADYDDCGRASLWVTNYERELHGLYHNDTHNGRVFFHFSTQAAGIANIGQTYVGWGTGFLDLDHDGREHLFFTNGHPNFYPRASAGRPQRPVLLRNLGEGRFRAITPQGGPYFQQDHNGRGVAFGDLDNDGRTDLVISHVNEPVVVLRNEIQTRNHWLGIALAGKKNRDVVGAKLTLEVGGRRLTRFAQGGGSYLSSSDRRHVFGLGEADRVGRLTVVWPWGKEEHWDGLAIDRYWRLEEGQGDKVTR